MYVAGYGRIRLNDCVVAHSHKVAFVAFIYLFDDYFLQVHELEHGHNSFHERFGHYLTSVIVFWGGVALR